MSSDDQPNMSIFFVVEVTRCGVLAISIQSFLSTVKLKLEKTLIEVLFPVFLSSL